MERYIEGKTVMSGTGRRYSGELDSSLAEELNFPESVKIVTGTHDHVCNAIGSGVCESGSCSNTVGTTEGLTAVLERSALTTESIENYQISCEPFAVKIFLILWPGTIRLVYCSDGL